MASETEPNSTSAAQQIVAPNPQKVRLQNGGAWLDAHQGPASFNVVMRTLQENNSQRWWLTNVGGNVHTIEQISSGRFLDAFQSGNFHVITQPLECNDTQRWRLLSLGGNSFLIQQVSTGRYLEATFSPDGQNLVVTREDQFSDGASWRLGNPT